MITDEQGYEWAKSKGISTLEECNRLESELKDMKEKHDMLIIWLKDNHKKYGEIIDEHR